MVERSINPVIIAGVVLLAIVISVGLFATWMNIRNSKGPRERRFLARFSVVFWLLLLSLMVLMYLVAPPGRYLLLVPYFLILPWLVYRASLRRQLLRQLEIQSQGAVRVEGSSEVKPAVET